MDKAAGSVKINNPLFAKCVLCLKTDEGVHVVKGKCECLIHCHYSCYEKYLNENKELGLCPSCKKTQEENECVSYCFCCFLLAGIVG
jgi:hypothetical protein